jgi:hypothetical protein
VLKDIEILFLHQQPGGYQVVLQGWLLPICLAEAKKNYRATKGIAGRESRFITNCLSQPVTPCPATRHAHVILFCISMDGIELVKLFYR